MKKNQKLNTVKKRRKPGSFLTQFHSKKNDCYMWLESRLEMMFALFLEFHPDVLKYATQPESIFIGETRYTPDFLVIYHDKSAAYYEVHHERFMTEDFRNRYNLASEFLASNNEPPLHLVTDKELDNEFTRNLKMLYQYLGNSIPPEIDIKSLPEGPITLEQLTDHLASLIDSQEFTAHNNPRLTALILLANRHYRADLKAPLLNDTYLVRG